MCVPRTLSGGIPGDVFKRPYNEVDLWIGEAMSAVDLDAMVNEMGCCIIETEAKLRHLLLHMLPRGVADGAAAPPPTSLEFYAPAKLELASIEVGSRVYAKADEDARRRLHTLLAEPPSSRADAAVCESMYELTVLSELEKGCTLTCWDSRANTSFTLAVQRCKRTYFDSVAALGRLHAADSQQLLVPRSNSFTAVDAVLPGGRLAQVTISLSHDVKLIGRGHRSVEGLVPAGAALRFNSGSGDIDLYWILPQHRYDEVVRSKQPSFPLIIADERDARTKPAKLQDAFDSATAASTQAPAAGSAAAKAEMQRWKQRLRWRSSRTRWPGFDLSWRSRRKRWLEVKQHGRR